MAPHLLRAVGDGTRPSALPGPPEDRAGGRPECRGGGAALSPARGIRRRRNSAPGVGVGVGSASPLTSEGTSVASGNWKGLAEVQDPQPWAGTLHGGGWDRSGFRADGRAGLLWRRPGSSSRSLSGWDCESPASQSFPRAGGGEGATRTGHGRVCARQERGGPPAGSHRGPPAYSRPQAGACSVNGAGRVWMALGPTSLTS